MEFIRKHMFLLVLAAVVTVGGVFLLVLWSSLSGDVRDRFAVREDSGRKLISLGSDRINEQWVAAKEKWVKDIGLSLQALQDKALEKNRNGLDPRVRVVPQFPGDGNEMIDTFPVDPEKHERHNIPRKFRSWYQEELQNLLAQLIPAAVPTASEIDDARRRAAAMATLSMQPREAGSADKPVLPAGVQDTPTGLAPSAAPMPGGDGGYIPVPPPVRPPGSFGSGAPYAGGAMTAVSEEALRKAMDALKLQKAREGAVYVTWDDRSKSLHEYSSWEIGGKPTARQMWEALVNLWIQRDIVAAIRATNDKVFESNQTPQNERNVTEAAIKRLVSVQVDGYDVLAATPSISQSPLPFVPMGFPAAAPAAPSAQPSAAEGTARTLSGRASNADYDVVFFSVTVVMNETELKTFIDQMEQRNFYTPLNVQMSQVTAQSTAAAGAVGSRYGMPAAPGPETGASADLYYYGTKPVMQVTLSFEALFMTEWERKLMPEELKAALAASGSTMLSE